MTRFEERLARTASSLLGWGLLGGLAACTGTTTVTDTGGPPGTLTTADLEALCAGDPPPADYQVSSGFVTVAPDTACPDAAAAQLEVLGCDFREWQGVTCAFTHVDEDQVLVD